MFRVSTSRQPNRRGEGARLRAEILAGAAAVLEETGNEDAVTLRAVARRVGIAAPSIYGHFADRDEMLLTVIAEAFNELDAALAAALAQDPDDELEAVCAVYVRFARERPGRYRVMFGRHRSTEGGAVNEPHSQAGDLSGADAFSRLVQAVAQRSVSGQHGNERAIGPFTGNGHDEATKDPLQVATAVWVALHGYVTLRESVPAFPWPPESELLDTLLSRLTSA